MCHVWSVILSLGETLKRERVVVTGSDTTQPATETLEAAKNMEPFGRVLGYSASGRLQVKPQGSMFAFCWRVVPPFDIANSKTANTICTALLFRD